MLLFRKSLSPCRFEVGGSTAYLNDRTYTSVFSSQLTYVPKKGGLVILGAYKLEDYDYYGDDSPRALLKITADNVVLYEGEVSSYFDRTVSERARAFNYKSSFNIEL